MVKPYRHTAPSSHVTISVAGVASLKERLEKFGKKIQTKAVRECFKAMAKPIVQSVSAAAPKSIGILGKNIKAKVIGKSKRTGQMTLRIGAQNKRIKIITAHGKRLKYTKGVKTKIAKGKITRGIKSYANPSKYSHLVAGGTKQGAKATNYLAMGLARSRDKAVLMFNREMATQVLIAGVEVKKA